MYICCHGLLRLLPWSIKHVAVETKLFTMEYKTFLLPYILKLVAMEFKT